MKESELVLRALANDLRKKANILMGDSKKKAFEDYSSHQHYYAGTEYKKESDNPYKAMFELRDNRIAELEAENEELKAVLISILKDQYNDLSEPLKEIVKPIVDIALKELK